MEDLEILYVLFQFEYQPKVPAASYSSIYAKEFKFSKNLKCDRKTEIESYFKSALIEEKEKAWKVCCSDFNFENCKYRDLRKLLKDFKNNFSADWELISKTEYDEWDSLEKVVNSTWFV